MVDVTYLAPEKNQAILTAHIDALSRAVRETGVVSGNRIVPATPASLAVTVEAGWIKVAGAPIETSEEEVTITTAHATLPRVDLICRDGSGTAVVIDGTAASIEDPKSLEAWRSYTSPVPSTSVPDGYVILGAVYVGPKATSIVADNIWMFAGGVGGLATAVSSPGSDNYPASEKAVATALAAKISTSDIQTSIGSPGSDSKVPSEKAVRTELGSYALSSKGVTNGDSHDHVGGDGAQIAHANLSGAGSNSHTTIDNHIASTSNPHSVTAAQAGAPALALLTEQGDMVQRGSTTWERTEHGAANQYWKCGGHGANNAWATKTWGVDFEFGDGSAVLVAQAKTSRCGVLACKITKAHIRSIDTAGALKTGSVTCSVHVHDRDAAIGAAVDTFALASASSFEETGISIAVAAGKYVTVVLSGISTVTEIVLSLEFEAT